MANIPGVFPGQSGGGYDPFGQGFGAGDYPPGDITPTLDPSQGWPFPPIAIPIGGGGDPSGGGFAPGPGLGQPRGSQQTGTPPWLRIPPIILPGGITIGGGGGGGTTGGGQQQNKPTVGISIGSGGTSGGGGGRGTIGQVTRGGFQGGLSPQGAGGPPTMVDPLNFVSQPQLRFPQPPTAPIFLGRFQQGGVIPLPSSEHALEMALRMNQQAGQGGGPERGIAPPTPFFAEVLQGETEHPFITSKEQKRALQRQRIAQQKQNLRDQFERHFGNYPPYALSPEDAKRLAFAPLHRGVPPEEWLNQRDNIVEFPHLNRYFEHLPNPSQLIVGMPYAGSYQQGGIVPRTGLYQVEGGEQVVPRKKVAKLHKGELVIPRRNRVPLAMPGGMPPRFMGSFQGGTSGGTIDTSSDGTQMTADEIAAAQAAEELNRKRAAARAAGRPIDEPTLVPASQPQQTTGFWRNLLGTLSGNQPRTAMDERLPTGATVQRTVYGTPSTTPPGAPTGPMPNLTANPLALLQKVFQARQAQQGGAPGMAQQPGVISPARVGQLFGGGAGGGAPQFGGDPSTWPRIPGMQPGTEPSVGTAGGPASYYTPPQNVPFQTQFVNKAARDQYITANLTGQLSNALMMFRQKKYDQQVNTNAAETEQRLEQMYQQQQQQQQAQQGGEQQAQTVEQQGRGAGPGYNPSQTQVSQFLQQGGMPLQAQGPGGQTAQTTPPTTQQAMGAAAVGQMQQQQQREGQQDPVMQSLQNAYNQERDPKEKQRLAKNIEQRQKYMQKRETNWARQMSEAQTKPYGAAYTGMMRGYQNFMQRRADEAKLQQEIYTAQTQRINAEAQAASAVNKALGLEEVPRYDPRSGQFLGYMNEATWGKYMSGGFGAQVRQQTEMQKLMETDKFKRWKTQQDNATRLTIAQYSQGKAPAAMLEMATFANSAMKQLNDAQVMFDDLADRGILGSVSADKFEDMIFGKGYIDPTLAPEDRYKIGKLREALSLASTAMMRAHTGRTAQQIYDDFRTSLSLAQGPDALRGAMDQGRDLLQDYIQAGSSDFINQIRGGTLNNQPPASSGGGVFNPPPAGGGAFVPPPPSGNISPGAKTPPAGGGDWFKQFDGALAPPQSR